MILKNMNKESIKELEHDHHFIIDSGQAEKRTKMVVALTLVMMIAEIAGGYLFGSMALLADGWHMGTHAGALGIALFAYIFARKHKNNPRFTFGTGKVGDLGGFASAIILFIVALMMVAESVERFLDPVSIKFNEAILVAVIGLLVNTVCAFMLQDHHHHHGDEEEDHSHGHHHHDQNLRAAYIHVIADALTSVFAIIALTAGKYLGWIWMDPLMGIVGALVIMKWALNLIRDTSKVLLDSSADKELVNSVREMMENKTDTHVTDLHIWRVGPKDFAAVISIVSKKPVKPDDYKKLIQDNFKELTHISIELNQI